MNMNSVSGWLLITAVGMAAGCSSSESGSAGAITSQDGQTLTGSVNAPGLPPDAKVMVIWSVSASTPDYAAKFGEGTIDGTTFTVRLSAPPPAEALNAWGNGYVGVGFVIAVPGSFQLGDGIVSMSNSDLQAQVLAGNFRQMIIWRSGAAQQPAWAGSFADGEFSCGQCVDEAATFDSITPSSCAELSLFPPDNQAECNWT